MDYCRQEHCSACHGTALDVVIDLPRFPMIGVFVDNPDDPGIPPVDQVLTICGDCGHMQLAHTVDPQILYNSDYFHRSGESDSARAGIDVFATYVRKVAGTRKFNRLLEVGCNDIYLLHQIQDLADEVFGIDPIWIGEPPPQGDDLHVLGGFVEDVDLEAALSGKPDLLISSMTFEHLKDPHETLRCLMESAADDALIVMQVPGTEMLLGNMRFDQLSHQHYQQFSLRSFIRMVELCGGKYVEHETNTPYWGAIMVAFEKGNGAGEHDLFRQHTKAEVSGKFAAFKHHLKITMDAMADFDGRSVYGFGAAQCVPSLAYFMESDLAFLGAVFDDNPERQNKYWPGLAVQTSAVKPDLDWEKSAILITAPDYARALVKRVSGLGAERIIVPAVAY
jgi:NDP-4-keto-2,6-dideoxyhexose 3-C-methyltransferase